MDFRASIYLDKRRIKNDGTAPLKVLVSNGSEKFITSLDIAIDTEQYERTSKRQNTISRIAIAKAEQLVAGINAMLVEEQLRDPLLTLSEVKEKVKAFIKGDEASIDDEKQLSLQEAFEVVAGTKSPSTAKIYRDTARRVFAFERGITPLRDINLQWITAFDQWLTREGCRPNTRNRYLRDLRAVINWALDMELISSYPFRRFRMPREETRKRSLSIEEMQELVRLPLAEKLEMYRNFFVLSFCLVGMNPIDILEASKKDVKGGRLEYYRAKTHKLYSVKIEPEAEGIIAKYPDEGGTACKLQQSTRPPLYLHLF